MQHRFPDHNLRLLTLLLWIPAFAFLLPHGILSQYLCPVLGIIPMSFSAVAAIVHMSGKAKSRAGNIAVDLFIACFLLGTLIPGWVFLAQSRGNSRYYWDLPAGVTMAGTYGSVPMMPHPHPPRPPRAGAALALGGAEAVPALPGQSPPADVSIVGRAAGEPAMETVEDGSDDSKEMFHSSDITMNDEEPRGIQF